MMYITVLTKGQVVRICRQSISSLVYVREYDQYLLTLCLSHNCVVRTYNISSSKTKCYVETKDIKLTLIDHSNALSLSRISYQLCRSCNAKFILDNVKFILLGHS